MTPKCALQTILGISVVGILFSGYLSYMELFRKSCALGGGCTNVGPLPACVYGFVMYSIVFAVALWGLCSRDQPAKKKRK